MSERKEQVSWTLDAQAIEIVKKKARQLADETGLKVSDSAAANTIIIESEQKAGKNGKK
jgi:hypothetical protein